jgi:lantibiotic modifying enzyme
VIPHAVEVPAGQEIETLQRAVERCADTLAGTAFVDHDRAGWLSWELTADGQPTTMRGGNPALYDGDSGTAYACAVLGVALDRSDLVDLAVRAARHAFNRSTGLGSALLSGRPGVELAVRQIEALTGAEVADVDVSGWPSADRGGVDLTDGLAGTLYAGSVVGAPLPTQRELVEALAAAAVPGPVGSCWPDPYAADQRPLCGLAHGASGVALALAEVAAGETLLTADVRSLIGAALAWERAWFDPIRGSWPDLRGESISYPAWWCHGAAGIGLVRLRLLVLQRAGLDLGLSEPSLLAEAGAAIRAGSAELGRALAGGGPPAGLTLCHGAGGALELLTLAAEVLGVEEHLRLGQQFAARLLAGLDRDPLRWTTGLPVLGGGGLFLGLGGAAVVLARLAFPERRIPPIGLL